MTNMERWRFYLKDLPSPEVYIEWGFYALISAALQRRVWLYPEGAHQLFPNLYTVLIGPPAAGKGRVLKQVTSIIKSEQMLMVIKMHEEEKLIPRYAYGADTTTFEALVRDLSQSIRAIKYKQTLPDGRIIDSVYSHNSICFLIEELGVLLRKNTEDTVNLLNQCFDSGNYRQTTKTKGEYNINNVCVSILAATTPSFIKDAFSDKIISEGFTSRVIMVYADEPRFYRMFPGLSQEQIAAHKELVTYIKDLSTVVGEVKFSSAAADFHREIVECPLGALPVMRTGRVNKDYRLDHYYSRKEAHWLKLCMILHFSEQRDSMTIERETMEHALKVLGQVEFRMHEAFIHSGRNPLNEVTKAIMRCIQEHANNGGVTQKRLWLKFHSDITTLDELKGILDFFQSTDQIRIETGGIIKPFNILATTMATTTKQE